MGKKLLHILLFAFFFFLIDACGSGQQIIKVKSPPGYDLGNPTVVHLNTDLDEISGICFYAKDTAVFAINDELGILFKIYLREKVEIDKWAFASGTDFEDIVLLDSTFYVLASKGKLFWFKFHTPDSMAIEHAKIKLPGENEFETLYYDFTKRKLIMICKECKSDTKHEVSAFAFDPATKSFSTTPEYIINSDEIANLTGDKKVRFKPSAAAIHPITKELFIVSSVNKLLVKATTTGKITHVYRLDPKLFKQPEGLSFTPAGDLLISNESAEIDAGTILIFKYQPPKK